MRQAFLFVVLCFFLQARNADAEPSCTTTKIACSFNADGLENSTRETTTDCGSPPDPAPPLETVNLSTPRISFALDLELEGADPREFRQHIDSEGSVWWDLLAERWFGCGRIPYLVYPLGSDRPYSRRLTIKIRPPNEQFPVTGGFTTTEFEGDHLVNARIELFGLPPWTRRWTYVFQHELTHLLLAVRARRSPSRWFDEGVATNSERLMHADPSPMWEQRTCDRKPRMLPLRRLFELVDYPMDGATFYAQSFIVVKWLVERGVDRSPRRDGRYYLISSSIFPTYGLADWTWARLPYGFPFLDWNDDRNNSNDTMQREFDAYISRICP